MKKSRSRLIQEILPPVHLSMPTDSETINTDTLNTKNAQTNTEQNLGSPLDAQLEELNFLADELQKSIMSIHGQPEILPLVPASDMVTDPPPFTLPHHSANELVKLLKDILSKLDTTLQSPFDEKSATMLMDSLVVVKRGITSHSTLEEDHTSLLLSLISHLDTLSRWFIQNKRANVTSSPELRSKTNSVNDKKETLKMSTSRTFKGSLDLKKEEGMDTFLEWMQLKDHEIETLRNGSSLTQIEALRSRDAEIKCLKEVIQGLRARQSGRPGAQE